MYICTDKICFAVRKSQKRHLFLYSHKAIKIEQTDKYLLTNIVAKTMFKYIYENETITSLIQKK